MSKANVERAVATVLGVIAVLGMLFAAFGAWFCDMWLRSPWGADGVQHEELMEVLPYFFWFAVWFGLLLGQRVAAKVVCHGRSFCWAAAGAILGAVFFQMAVGDLVSPDDHAEWLSLARVHAAADVIASLCALVGAATGAALAWRLPEGMFPGWFYSRKRN